MSEYLERLKKALSDRYTVEHEIGSGGMATVYLAVDVRHNRKVAVKVLRPELAAALGPERFVHEIEIIAQLTHPHIVPLHESGEADGFLYYVMPYIDGESLRDRIARGRELPINDAVRIMRDVVDALASAHKHGVVHRDIKPDNVLFSENHAVVTDFGVAKAVSQATGQQAITTAGVALGTPSYMAPEQATADPTTDHRADIYATGAMAYEMLTGRPPFLAPNPQAVLAAHLNETPEPLSKRRPSVPPPLEQLIMRCLEKSPADRWQTAAEMLPLIEGLMATSGGITPTGTVPAAIMGKRVRARPRVVMAGVAGAAAIALAAWAGIFGGGGSRDGGAGAPMDLRSVAVLPFTNTSGDQENEAFTNGIHDDLLTRIAKIGDLKVISRTSVMEYRDNRTKNIREIAQELGVATVLEGGVQRAGKMVRINAQLIDAQTDAPLWSDTYNRELTVENIFTIQSDIAEQIASALQATLSPVEREQISAAPTDNLAAYDFYQRGNYYFDRGRSNAELRNAAQMFEAAIDQDTAFALAYARLSETYGLLWWLFYDRTEDRILRARRAAEEAMRLDPDLAEAHVAMGDYHYRLLDYDRALEEYSVAEELEPGNANALASVAYVQRRQGKMPEAVTKLERATELDPMSVNLASETGDTYARLRDAASAERHYDRAMNIGPDFADAYYGKAKRLRIRLQGNPRGARAVLEEAERAGAVNPTTEYVRMYSYMLDRDYQRALDRLASADDVFETQHFYIPKALYYAQIYGLAGNPELVRAYYDSAQAILESKIEEEPDDSRYHSSLGLVHAGLGRAEDAIREGLWAVELLPVSKEAMRGFYRVEDLARIYAAVGEYDEAVDRLTYLMSIPGDLTKAYIDIDPAWEPLRNHPEFRRFMAGLN